MSVLKTHFSKGLIAIIAAVCGGAVEATTDLIKKNFEPALVNARNTVEDWLAPLPSGALIGINLMFYMPATSADQPWAEGVSASIPAKSCREPGGHDIVRVFNESPNAHRTNAVMMIHCRPSGRVSVDLAPQSGDIVQLYNGRFKDGEKKGFPGVPGSYYAGVLTMHRLDAVEPSGPRVPVNECQIDNSCDPKMCGQQNSDPNFPIHSHPKWMLNRRVELREVESSSPVEDCPEHTNNDDTSEQVGAKAGHCRWLPSGSSRGLFISEYLSGGKTSARKAARHFRPALAEIHGRSLAAN